MGPSSGCTRIIYRCALQHVHSSLFAEIISALSAHGLVPFDLEEIGETEPGGIDFHVIFRKKNSGEFARKQLRPA